MVFAIVGDDELWLKADKASYAEWNAAGAERFTYAGKDGKTGFMDHSRTPADCDDDPDTLRRWGRRAEGKEVSVTVRPAVAGDETEIHRLLVALAVYEREPDAVLATPATLRETLFGERAEVWAHLAEIDGRVVGVALWFRTYSTWTGQPSLYLEDLFVDQSARGCGAGLALFRALAREAKAQGCARVDWAVLDWNEGARGFYTRIGAHHSRGWEPWRLEGEALDRLADG